MPAQRAQVPSADDASASGSVDCARCQCLEASEHAISGANGLFLRCCADRRRGNAQDRWRAGENLFAGQNRGRLLQVPQQDRSRDRCGGAKGLPQAASARRRCAVAFREGLPRVDRDATLSGSGGLKSKGTRDRAASVRARLLNLARQRGEDFQITLRNYLFERFLYRLGRSPVRERFVLKGAMLLRLWADQPYRATLDLDLLAHGSSDTESASRDIAAICNTDVDDDGIKFDPSSISIEPIRAQDEYSGVRVVFGARLGTVNEQLQVDIGFGDA